MLTAIDTLRDTLDSSEESKLHYSRYDACFAAIYLLEQVLTADTTTTETVASDAVRTIQTSSIRLWWTSSIRS